MDKERLQAEKLAECEWGKEHTEWYEDEHYETACGQAHLFFEGTPKVDLYIRAPHENYRREN